MQENRMFSRMLQAAKLWLSERRPEEIAAKAGELILQKLT